MRVLAGVVVVSACVLAAVIARPAAQGAQGAPAQGAPPQGRPAPKNLQVLPKDWTGQQVQMFMQTFVRTGTGMMCNDCHMPDRSLDDKKEKQAARQMIKLMMASNDLVKDIGEPAAAGTYKVTCYTCHRGIRKPINAPPSGGGH